MALISKTMPRPVRFMWYTAKQDTLRNCPRSKSCRRSMQNYWKKKTTASGELIWVQSVRKNARPQNEILCSKGLGGAAPGKQAERKITEGFSALRAGVY